RTRGPIGKTSRNNYQLIESNPALHLHACGLANGAKHGGRLPALSLGDVNTDLRILQNFSVGFDDVLLYFFFGSAFGGNRGFQEGQGADVSLAINFNHGVEIRLSED